MFCKDCPVGQYRHNGRYYCYATEAVQIGTMECCLSKDELRKVLADCGRRRRELAAEAEYEKERYLRLTRLIYEGMGEKDESND